jgi:acetyl-CoA synthetase
VDGDAGGDDRLRCGVDGSLDSNKRSVIRGLQSVFMERMTNKFSRLINPRSIAVFGGAQAEELIRQCDKLGYTGEIYPVHPSKTEIAGRKVYRSVADLPKSPDAAYVGVNRNLTIDIIRDLALRGSGGAVCYATGFTESGEEGSLLQRQLLEASGDMPLVGPNCYGLVNYVTGASLWPDQQGGKRVDKGVAIITMSSNIGFNLSMQRRGLPIAYIMSLGNRLKFNLHDAIHALASHEAVTAIGLYLETMPDPKAFEEAVNFARSLAKPIVAIKTGRSDVAKHMVVSHTASLAGSDALVSALFERLGVARVESLEALIESLKVLHVLGPVRGGRLGAMSTSGGDLTLLADALTVEISMPPLSHEAVAKVRAVAHERVNAANPLDWQMFTWGDEEANAKLFSAFMSDDFDVTLCVLDYPRADKCDQSTWLGAERGFVRAVKETRSKGAVMATFADTVDESVAARLMKDGVALLAGINEGIAALQAAVEIGKAWAKPVSVPLLPKADLPNGETKVLTEAESKECLSRFGAPIPAAKIVCGVDEAVKAANELGYPVVAKALGVAHKTDVGGVKLNLRNADEVSAAVNEMSKLASTFLIEKMVRGVVAELIVGVARDEQFGPYLVVGGGGILVELLKDSASLLLPTSKEEILRALSQLKCAPLLKGFRGAAQGDVNAVADVILKVAKMIESDPAAIVELDINPLMVLPEGQGVVAADALIKLAPKENPA